MRPILYIIDDEASIGASLALALKSDYSVKVFQDPFEGLNSMENDHVDLVLLDLKIGSVNGLSILAKIKEMDPQIAVIMMTAYGSIGTSVEAMQSGAYSYITKPLDITELKVLIKQALGVRKLTEQVLFLADELKSHRQYDQIIGDSAPMQKVFSLIGKVKDIDTTVLITGESGTGKELVAKAIHEKGIRSKERFLIVNCAAIPEHLLEIEFFGYKRGAFTGAIQDKKGKFQLADNGTLFLDEIGDMPLGLQSKVLRVLQDKEFTPVGASHSVKVDVRIIAATNRNLLDMIDRQEFREDLYYRLKVIEIKMPPLRERTDDIPALSHFFLNQFSREMNKPIKGISNEAIQYLKSLSFPGNVRQLANILEYAAIISSSDMIVSDDFPEEVFRKEPPEQVTKQPKDWGGQSLKEVEEQVIRQALLKNQGKRGKTADELGISRRGLLNKIKEYGIDDPNEFLD